MPSAVATSVKRTGIVASEKSHHCGLMSGESNRWTFRYHSGMIWAALGEADAARADLSAALATDPAFSATGARDARETLAGLGG